MPLPPVVQVRVPTPETFMVTSTPATGAWPPSWTVVLTCARQFARTFLALRSRSPTWIVGPVPQAGNRNAPTRICQPTELVTGTHWFTYQNVQSSTGSTVSAV